MYRDDNKETFTDAVFRIIVIIALIAVAAKLTVMFLRALS
jgi:hypothetical protein